MTAKEARMDAHRLRADDRPLLYLVPRKQFPPRESEFTMAEQLWSSAVALVLCIVALPFVTAFVYAGTVVLDLGHQVARWCGWA